MYVRCRVYLPIWLAQSKPESTPTAYNMLRQVPNAGLQPVALVKVKLGLTVPVAFPNASRAISKRKAAICKTTTKVSAIFMCLPHVKFTMQDMT